MAKTSSFCAASVDKWMTGRSSHSTGAGSARTEIKMHTARHVCKCMQTTDVGLSSAHSFKSSCKHCDILCQCCARTSHIVFTLQKRWVSHNPNALAISDWYAGEGRGGQELPAPSGGAGNRKHSRQLGGPQGDHEPTMLQESSQRKVVCSAGLTMETAHDYTLS